MSLRWCTQKLSETQFYLRCDTLDDNNTNYCNVISRLYLKVAHPQVQKILRFESLEMQFPAFWASQKVFLLTNEYSFEEANVLDSSKRCTLKSPCTISMTLNCTAAVMSEALFNSSIICYSFLYKIRTE